MYSLFSYFILPVLLVKAFGINVEDQIEMSFSNAKLREYDLVVMGNSKLYCGINPDFFTIKSYNFSHNNDNYNQIYFKLKWLDEQGKKFDYLVLGTDYFQFNFISDSRNYAYSKYFEDEYILDYRKDAIGAKWLKGKVEFLKPYKLKTLLDIPYVRHDLKENGQFVRRGNPGEALFQKRQFKFLDIQVQYFDRILQYCQEKDITVFICMQPLRKMELNQYSHKEIMQFNEFISKKLKVGIYYLDFSVDHPFDSKDYIDMSHLSQESAKKFTKMINERIIQIQD